VTTRTPHLRMPLFAMFWFAARVNARVGALAKSVGQPCAGNPHARLEGAPVGQPCEDIQAPPTERSGNSYGLAKAKVRPGPTLQSVCVAVLRDARVSWHARAASFGTTAPGTQSASTR
jgi:hypothetical protein